jgi:hypothetical protein
VCVVLGESLVRRAFRLTAGCVAVLFGIACLSLTARVFVRVGLPEGVKAVVYLWILTLAVPLPVSFGVNLVGGLVPWRLFAGWWLIACGVVYLMGILWIMPDYRVDLASLVAVVAPGLALLSGGSLLLLLRQRQTDGR